MISRLLILPLLLAVLSAAVEAPADSRRRTLHQFRDKDGNVTFTNRPEKYRHRGDMVEVSIRYERISVPRQYSQYTSPAQYTTGNIEELIRRYARHYRLDENLVYAVIKAESNFDARAVSRAGARGLMQLMPATAAEMGVTRIFDPAQNIAGGTQYLRKMLDIFHGDTRLALAAYNAGPNAVKEHHGIPPYSETRDYVTKVLSYYKRFAHGNSTLRGSQLSRARVAPKTSAATLAGGAGKFVVYFHSGLTQPADNVEDREPYYYIQYGRRTYPVRKDLVKRIETPA
jgi:hypothetical protein